MKNNQANMDKFISFERFRLVTNGKPRIFEIGDTVSTNVYRSFNSATKARFISMGEAKKANSTKLNWSAEELIAVIDLYEDLFDEVNGTCNDWAVAFRFAKDVRFANRGIQGVRFIVGQIKSLDSKYAGVGCTSVSQQLQSILQDRDPERYTSEEVHSGIDSLLLSLRG